MTSTKTDVKVPHRWGAATLSDLQDVTEGHLKTADVAAKYGVTTGAVHCAINRARKAGTITSRDLLEVTVFRELAVRAVESGETTWSELARHCGYRCERSRGRGDGSGLRRRLGIVPYSSNHRGAGKIYIARTIPYDVACSLVRALSLDPVDFDL